MVSTQEPNPTYIKRYIDDIVRAFSGNRDTIKEFASFMNDFHPSVKLNWSTSNDELPFLDLVLKPTSDHLTTSIHYKPTNTHSYLNYTSSHLICSKTSIPYSQFLRLCCTCTDNVDFDLKSKEMAHFFRNCSYPQNIVDQVCTRVLARPRVAFITSESAADVPPTEYSTIHMILTYRPSNQLLKNIISRNCHLLHADPETAAILQLLRILYAYQRNQNPRDHLVRSTLT